MGMATTKKQIIIYCRVSSEAQRDGVSLNAQEEALKQYCQLFNFEAVRVIKEVASAKNLKQRPLLQEALKELGKTADGLIIYRLDRLSRSVKDLSSLVEQYFNNKHSLISFSENLNGDDASGRFLLHILISVAELERNKISDNTKLSLAHLKKAGKRVSRFPQYGFKHLDGRLIPSKEEQAIIQIAKQQHQEGCSSYRIAKNLTKDGKRNRAQGLFTTKAVIRMIEAA